VVIDAHLHLWNTQRLHYGWLQRPENSAINRTFGFEDSRRGRDWGTAKISLKPAVGSVSPGQRGCL
jgi:predicted TIM-barrel fold metal-dependent hydrolase